MNYESIADIYSAHEQVSLQYNGALSIVTDEEAKALPNDGGWTIEQIAEHVAIVEDNMKRICEKRIAAARENGKPGSGAFQLSDEFAAKSASVADAKLQAPERVHPQGGVTIAEATDRLAATDAEIVAFRSDLEKFDGSDHRFPHPFFGDLTAAEWLVIRIGHKARHTAQIKAILEKIRK